MNFPSPYRVHFSSDSLIAATSGFNGFRGFLNLALLLLVSNLKKKKEGNLTRNCVTLISYFVRS